MFASRNALQRRLGWLLAVALLLIAQASASAHAISHLGKDGAGDPHGKSLLHLVQCGLCITGAAVGGPALVDHVPPALRSERRHEAPAAVPIRGRSATAVLAYRSRAPPSRIRRLSS